NISMSGVTDPGKDGMYNYQVNLDLADIAAILGELADRGLAHSPSEISEGLAGATRALYRLQAASAGLLAQELTPPTDGTTRRLLKLRVKGAP
ncbi:hypothetical protein LDP08_24775, partial [Ralstonia pseudosolanacearum]|uniref:hypothetical protein n=1 Tax=Ralstonia pseudosolanacearum TaxID=1310165 RepID=UPI003CEAD654